MHVIYGKCKQTPCAHLLEMESNNLNNFIMKKTEILLRNKKEMIFSVKLLTCMLLNVFE